MWNLYPTERFQLALSHPYRLCRTFANKILQDEHVYLVGGGFVCSACATCACGGCGGMTAAGTTAIDCGVRVGTAAMVTRCCSTTVGSTRRVKRGGGWLADDWLSAADDSVSGWLRSNVWDTAAALPRNGPLLRRGLNTQKRFDFLIW